MKHTFKSSIFSNMYKLISTWAVPVKTSLICKKQNINCLQLSIGYYMTVSFLRDFTWVIITDILGPGRAFDYSNKVTLKLVKCCHDGLILGPSHPLLKLTFFPQWIQVCFYMTTTYWPNSLLWSNLKYFLSFNS